MLKYEQSSRLSEERAKSELAAYVCLSKEELARWNQCRSTHRIMAYKSKEVLAFTVVEGKPVIEGTFTNDSVSLSKDGLSSNWYDEHGDLFTVSHSPKEIFPGCFMWHPRHNTLEVVDWYGENSLKFSVVWRTEHNPGVLVEGKSYLMEKLVFDRSFKGL